MHHRRWLGDRTMRALVAACLLGVCSASLSSTGLLNAHQYLENLEEKRERRMTQAEIVTTFRKLIDKLYASGNDPKDEHFPPIRKIDLVRNFVKSVGPVLGKQGHEADSPLHQVMERANDLLGRDHDPKEHPHREAIAIVKTMATFYETVINAHAQMSKDEL